MDFVTHNTAKIDINYTHLQGYVDATYKRLKAVFGQPNKGDGYKVDAEWNIRFADGTVATIYNYKDGVNYLGRGEGTPKTEITDWHVGGNDKKAVDLVVAALAGGVSTASL